MNGYRRVLSTLFGLLQITILSHLIPASRGFPFATVFAQPPQATSPQAQNPVLIPKTNVQIVRPTLPTTLQPGQIIQQAPLKGFVDLHTHPLANLAFGGKLIYGGVDVGALLPADPDCRHNVRATSEQEALGHDKSTHGGHDFFSNPCGDELRKAMIHGLQTGLGGADETEDATGYPDFSQWPVWNDLTHQKMWVEWIRRAYYGGLRVMVALAVNNKTLGDMTAGPGDYPTDDRSSADLQIGEIKGFVSRHPDFMEVAYNSADVHRIVSANKLAVIVGIEVDHIGDLQSAQNPAVPSDAEVKAEIDRLYGEGVRYIFPIHVLDNAFGGTAAYVNLFNVSNWRESGHPYKLICASPADGISYFYDNNDFGVENIAAQMLKTGGAVISINEPQCPSGQKNSLELTSAGVTAIKEMMRLGMLIDIDHMSQASADHALSLALYYGYPVNSGHNGLRGALGPGSQTERAFRADQYATIGKLHGMAGVGSGNLNAQQWLAQYNKVMQAMGSGYIVGAFGTDTDGFALGMPPRLASGGGERPGPQYREYQQCAAQGDCAADFRGHLNSACVSKQLAFCRKQYPNAFIPVPVVPGSNVQYSSTFPPSTDGTKTWNYNTDGVAHYGMLWDFLQDVRSLPGGAAAVDNNFMFGADYFFHTWQIAEAQAAKVK